MERVGLTQRVKRCLPAPLKKALRWLLGAADIPALRPVVYWGTVKFCPVCQHRIRRFKSFGVPQRPDALCPVCNALERHRLAWIFLDRHTDLFASPKRMLHFAPEPALARRLAERLQQRYITADLSHEQVHVRLDLCRLPFATASVDLIFCSHVLEHVPDDLQAMRELRRVLRQTGSALIQVPISASPSTDEDPSLTEPEDRARRFGQHDHVRLYGLDFADRLARAGFLVRKITSQDVATAPAAQRMALKDECLFHCVAAGDPPF